MSRPALFGEPASQAIRVRVTRGHRRALEQVARENRATLTEIVREAINTYVADYKDATVFRGPKPAGTA